MAQRGGLLELRIVNKSKQEQSVTLKLGKLQALAALTKQLGGLAARPADGPCTMATATARLSVTIGFDPARSSRP